MNDSDKTHVQPTEPIGSPVDDTGSGDTDTRTTRREHRPSTIIWGFVVAVVGAGVLARALGAEFDNDLALIVVLGAAGIALLLASIFSAVARR